MVAPLFFLLIFAVFGFGRLFLTQMEVEDAMEEAGRFDSTGNHLPDPNNPEQYLSHVNSTIATLQQATFGDTVTISVTSDLKLMSRSLYAVFQTARITSCRVASFKNEPFPSGNTEVAGGNGIKHSRCPGSVSRRIAAPTAYDSLLGRALGQAWPPIVLPCWLETVDRERGMAE
jgi:TadE-like protein